METAAPASWYGNLTGFKPSNACMSETCVLTQSISTQEPRPVAVSNNTKQCQSTAAELWHTNRSLSQKSLWA